VTAGKDEVGPSCEKPKPSLMRISNLYTSLKLQHNSAIQIYYYSYYPYNYFVICLAGVECDLCLCVCVRQFNSDTLGMSPTAGLCSVTRHQRHYESRYSHQPLYVKRLLS